MSFVEETTTMYSALVAILERTDYPIYYGCMPTMQLAIQEAQANLAQHIASLKPGDRIILCHEGLPVAEILPMESRSEEPRPVGLGKGLAEVPRSFYDPLPASILNDFEGGGGNDRSR